jgi:hypothetical protein
VLDGAQRDRVRARRRRRRGDRVRNGVRCGPHHPQRQRRRVAGQDRRDAWRGKRRYLTQPMGLPSGGRRPRRSDGVARRRRHPRSARTSPGTRRCTSPWPRRRAPRLRNRRGLGRRRDRDWNRRRRRRRRGPRRRARLRRLGRRRRLGERRQEEQRIDVPLRVSGLADTEVHVRKGLLRHSARADRANRVALGDGRPARDGDGAEMEQRDGVAVGRLDRDRPPACRHGPGERHDPARRRDDRGTRLRADVDSAVETARVRIGAEAECMQNRPLHRPGPPLCRCRHDERGRRGAAREPREQGGGLLPVLQTATRVASGLVCCQI